MKALTKIYTYWDTQPIFYAKIYLGKDWVETERFTRKIYVLKALKRISKKLGIAYEEIEE